ncbi:MAG: hypothetical protein M3P95_12115 [Actinomycetota bacterium]|jgi:hypothetical protein|nr:hypothetical protein [Actinomycetota bacterium]
MSWTSTTSRCASSQQRVEQQQGNAGIAGQVIAVVCDTNVGVLATLLDTGTATCDAGGGRLSSPT